MDLLIPSLSHACILATCTDPCLHPGDHHRYRLASQIALSKQHAPDAFGTWLAQGGELITIGKYSNDSTLVYIPSQDTFYFASPAVIISQECPAHTIFVGQFVIDNDAADPQSVQKLAAGSLLLLGLAMWAAFWMAGRITAPLHSLKQAADRMQAGELVATQATGIAECNEVAAALTQAGPGPGEGRR